MKNERLFELLNDIDEKFIEESENITTLKTKKKNRHTPIKLLAACLCLLLISAAVIGIVKKPTEPPAIPNPVITPDSDNSITFDVLQNSSQSPINYGSPALSSDGTGGNTALAEEYHPFAAITVRLLETLPDVYTFYDRSNTQYMILKMETLEVLHGNDIPKEFYFLIPEGCFTDFSIYDRFVISDVVQYGYDYSVMYNIKKDCPLVLDMVLLGCYGLPFTSNAGGGDMIAFDENGNFDPRLYESTEGFSGGSGWHNEENREHIIKEIGTLEVTEQRFRNNTWSGYLQNDFFVQTFSDFSYKAQLALEYLKNTENGLYVPEFEYYSTAYTRKEEKVVFRRFIDGIPTNETITIYPYKAERTTASFDETELIFPPMLRPAFTKICEEFEAGKITPPHIEGFENMENTIHGIFPWYAKTEEGIVGIIQVSWFYKWSYETPSKNRFDILFDDAYFIVKPDSNTCSPINRDELLKLLGDFETTYIYTGEYDNQGKVYEGRNDEYVTIY
ncbi:MAG: hypothetical protein E7566_06435 [Ruminococcaceae bacterium]|nr:hypothetical protein [Oscillospiraceae bacterium]